MKRSRRWVFLALILFFSILLVNYIENNSKLRLTNQEMKNTCSVLSLSTKWVENITLIINITEGGSSIFHNLTLKDNITVFHATIVAIGEENIDYYSTVAGVFVRGLSINNTWYSDTGYRFWLYWVNGILGGISCSKLEITNNSVIEWKYTSENPYGDNTNPINFWIFAGIFGGIAAACAVGIYLIIKKGV